MVENKTVDFDELKEIAMRFIDNGGGLDKNNKFCSWCKGAKDPSSSDHPTKAVISLQTDRRTNYETYIKVLDILNSAYTNLRNRLSIEMFQQNYTSLVNDYELSNFSSKELKERIALIRSKYPQFISDAEITK